MIYQSTYMTIAASDCTNGSEPFLRCDRTKSRLGQWYPRSVERMYHLHYDYRLHNNTDLPLERRAWTFQEEVEPTICELSSRRDHLQMRSWHGI